MALGNLLRKGAELADKAGESIITTASGLKERASNLTGDDKDEVVFDDAIDYVQEALTSAGLATPEINTVLNILKEQNPYRD